MQTAVRSEDGLPLNGLMATGTYSPCLGFSGPGQEEGKRICSFQNSKGILYGSQELRLAADSWLLWTRRSSFVCSGAN